MVAEEMGPSFDFPWQDDGSARDDTIACMHNSALLRHRNDVNFRLRAKGPGSLYFQVLREAVFQGRNAL